MERSRPPHYRAPPACIGDYACIPGPTGTGAGPAYADAVTAASDSLTPRQKWGAFAVTVAVAIATILDLVKVNVTLAPIEHTLGATSSQSQLIVAGYVLAFGILLVPSGRLGDLWNRKAMFIIGLLMTMGWR